MNWQHALVGAFVLSAAFVRPVSAQNAPAPQDENAPVQEAVPAAAVPTGTIRVAAMTPIEFEFVTELSSKTSKIDAMFPIRLTRPVEVNGRIVVPAGAMGEGQVVHSAKSGWGGKAGELIVAVRYVEASGVRVPLRRFRMGELQVGTDRKDEAFAVGVIVSPLLMFAINGGEKIIAPGARANAIVSTDTEVPAPAAPAANASN